jgi:anti-sigma regulatory factor (Ser/Thr protein kinase)
MLWDAIGKVADASAEDVVRAAERAVPGDIDDDMAIVVVRTSREDLDLWEKDFPAEPIRVSEARREAQATFTEWGLPPEQVELACLLVSEVVTNVVLHTAAPPRPRRIAFAPAGAGTAPGGSLLSGWGDTDEFPTIGASKRFTLRLRRGAAAVWAEVFDTDLRLPRIRSAGETDEGGRGLYLVDQLATRWGSRPTRDGKAVWFELPARS